MIKLAVTGLDHGCKQPVDEAGHRQRQAELVRLGEGSAGIFELPFGRATGGEVVGQHALTVLTPDR